MTLSLVDKRRRKGALDFTLHITKDMCVQFEDLSAAMRLKRPTLNEHYCKDGSIRPKVDLEHGEAISCNESSSCNEVPSCNKASSTSSSYANRRARATVYEPIDIAHLIEHLTIDILVQRDSEKSIRVAHAGYTSWFDRKADLVKVTIASKDDVETESAMFEALTMVIKHYNQ